MDCLRVRWIVGLDGILEKKEVSLIFSTLSLALAPSDFLKSFIQLRWSTLPIKVALFYEWCIFLCSEYPPSKEEIEDLERHSHGIPLKFCLVEHGRLNFFSFNKVELPILPWSFRATDTNLGMSCEELWYNYEFLVCGLMLNRCVITIHY